MADILERRVKQAIKGLNGHDCSISAIIGDKAMVRLDDGRYMRVTYLPAADKRRTKVLRIDGVGCF